MKHTAVAVIALFLLLTLLPIVAPPTEANSPPVIKIPPSRTIDVNQQINLAQGLTVSDPDGDTVDVRWDYDAARDSNNDGNLTNDNEYHGANSTTNVPRAWGTPGNYTITVTAIDSFNNSAWGQFLIHVKAVIGEKHGEYNYTEKLSTPLTVARDGFVSYRVHLHAGDQFRVKVDSIAEGTAVGVLWVEDKNYIFMKTGTLPTFYDAKKSKEAVKGSKFSLTDKAPETGFYYIVFYNKLMTDPSFSHISDSYVRFDMSIEDMGKPATIDMTAIALGIVVMIVLVIIVVMTVYLLTKKKKYAPLEVSQVKTDEKDPLAHVPPDQRPMWEEWLKYEKTYGEKHPNAPYPLTKAATQEEAPKFEHYTHSVCGNTLSYDNFTKMFYCYKCKMKVDQAHAVPPQPKAPPPAPVAPPPVQPYTPPPTQAPPPVQQYTPPPAQAPPPTYPQYTPPPTQAPPPQYPAQPVAPPPPPPMAQKPMPPPPPPQAPQYQGAPPPPPPMAQKPMPPPPPPQAPQYQGGPPPPPPAVQKPLPPPPPPPGMQQKPLPPPPPPA